MIQALVTRSEGSVAARRQRRHPNRTLLLGEPQRSLPLCVVVFCWVPQACSVLTAEPRSRKRRILRNTFAYILGVSSPVCVFCWLGWYTPNSRRPASGKSTSAPCA